MGRCYSGHVCFSYVLRVLLGVFVKCVVFTVCVVMFGVGGCRLLGLLVALLILRGCRIVVVAVDYL